jgi:colicin import membrane protein
MINELQVAKRIADGTLPSPQQFGAGWYWAIRISGTGAAWRESENEFVWREPMIWLTPEMCRRATGLPILIDHPASGTLNSQEFAARCVGVTTYAYVRGEEFCKDLARLKPTYRRNTRCANILGIQNPATQQRTLRKD